MERDRYTNFTVKRAVVHEDVRDSLKQKKIKKVNHIYKYCTLQRQGASFMFTGKTLFNVTEFASRGWSSVGERAIQRRKRRILFLTVITAISREGALHTAFVRGSVNANVFGVFLLGLLRYCQGITHLNMYLSWIMSHFIK